MPYCTISAPRENLEVAKTRKLRVWSVLPVICPRMWDLIEAKLWRDGPYGRAYKAWHQVNWCGSAETPRIREDRPPPAGCRRVKVPALPTSSRLPSGPLLRWRGEVGCRSCVSPPSCLHFSRTVKTVLVCVLHTRPSFPSTASPFTDEARRWIRGGTTFWAGRVSHRIHPLHVTVCARLDFALHHVLTIRRCGAPALWPKKPFIAWYKTLQIALWHLRTQANFIRLPHEQYGPTAACRGRYGREYPTDARSWSHGRHEQQYITFHGRSEADGHFVPGALTYKASRLASTPHFLPHFTTSPGRSCRTACPDNGADKALLLSTALHKARGQGPRKGICFAK